MDPIFAWLSRRDFNAYEQIALGITATAIAGYGWRLLRGIFSLTREARDLDNTVLDYLQREEDVRAHLAFTVRKVFSAIMHWTGAMAWMTVVVLTDFTVIRIMAMSFMIVSWFLALREAHGLNVMVGDQTVWRAQLWAKTKEGPAEAGPSDAKPPA